MTVKNANDVLRERLRALSPPPPDGALRTRVLLAELDTLSVATLLLL